MGDEVVAESTVHIPCFGGGGECLECRGTCEEGGGAVSAQISEGVGEGDAGERAPRQWECATTPCEAEEAQGRHDEAQAHDSPKIYRGKMGFWEKFVEHGRIKISEVVLRFVRFRVQDLLFV